MDLTVIAIPGYFSSMGAEYLYLKRRAATEGAKPSDYERFARRSIEAAKTF